LLGRGIVIHAYHRIETRVPGEGVGESLERILMDAHIRVDEYEVLAAHNSRSVIARSRRAARAIDPNVTEAVPRDYGLERLGRAVVDDQHLKIFTL
jgi:hypothetical protein